MVLDRQDSMLFTYPEKHFRFPAPVDPSIVEVLLLPFFDQGEPVGTIWVVAHDDERKFDTEDARIVQELCRFTTSAYFKLRDLGYVKDLRLHRGRGAASDSSTRCAVNKMCRFRYNNCHDSGSQSHS